LAVVPVTVARQAGKHPNNLDHSSAVPCVNPSSDRNRGAKRFGRVAVGFYFPAFNGFSSAMFARYIRESLDGDQFADAPPRHRSDAGEA
jgi:hypothetical protein